MAKLNGKRLLSFALAILMTLSMTYCMFDAGMVTAQAAIEDPISDSDFSGDVKNINEVLAAADNETVTVLGQLVYRYGNYDSMNSAILEDVIDGEVTALQIYNSLDTYAIGDVLKITATKSTYGGVPQISSATSVEVVKSAKEAGAVISAKEYDDFASLQADYALSAYVMVKDVTLGEYNSDGSTVVTDKNNATMNIYRAASYPEGVVAGEKVNLYACASAYNSTKQLRVGSKSDYVVTNDTKAPVITVPTYAAAEVGVDYRATVDVADNVGVEAVKMTYKVGTTTATVDMTETSTAGKFEATVPGSAIKASASSIELSFEAVDAKGNKGTAKGSVAITDLPRILSVTPAANAATGDDKTPKVSFTFENAGSNPTASLTLNGEKANVTVSGNTASHTPSKALADGKVKAVATVTRADGKSSSYTWTFTIGESLLAIYAGQIHSHTAEYSDGSGTLEDAYDYVLGLSDYENVDFLAVTDHSNYFDTKGGELGTMDDASSGNGKWAEANATTNEYNDKQSDKIFLYGYEMTWSGGPGHINTYNTVGFVSRNNEELNNKVNDAGMQAYYQLLKDHPDSISQFNHPGTTFGTFADFAYWDPEIDERISLVEVGNGEGAIGGSAYWPSYEYYTLALDKGWHVAPTNNQDNHKGLWGNSNTARTCIVTDDFSKEGIYNAMRDMRVFATEDQNLEIYYYLNDNLMGSILSDCGDKVRIYAEISDPDKEDIGEVSVIANGGVTVHSEKIDSNSGVLDVELNNDYSYYYIKIVQPDKEILVTAPVWTSDVLKIGITNLVSDAVIPVLDEELTLTTSLFNYEEEDLVIDSMVYAVDGEEVETVSKDLASVAAGGEEIYTYKLTPAKIGNQTVSVTVNATMGDVPYVFTANLDLDVLDPSELIDIGIDYGHSNFYVSGNYAGSDAALIELFAQNGIRSSYVKDDITYDAIKDYKLFILTVPFKSYDTSVADSLYTEDEIAALREYAENGGNLVICSKSDRGDPSGEGEQASVITNEILEAVGATSRIAEGIVVDNERKENEAYRLYFTEEGNYNYDNMFAKGILENTNNSFSCYNGAPVILGEGAEVIVKGYDTTWGASYKTNFDGSAYVPNYESDKVVVEQGDVAVMASETLPGGGWCIVSGVTFFSTFEVKVELENAGTLQNSNHQMVMNIIDAIVPEPTITDIADVQAAEEGRKFTIEGIVTSNASGYDKETAFFDCIYAQDETAGINLFPVAESFRIGQKVRVTGVTSSYNNERQLKVSSIELIDDSINPVAPLLVTAAEAMSDEYIGSLLRVKGTVDEVLYASDGTLETIMVKDDEGDIARVFIDGYIMKDYRGLDDIQVGDSISAIGLGSMTCDTSALEPVYYHRLRVRNRAEIVLNGGDYGDVDADGEVTMKDVVTIQKHLAELLDLAELNDNAMAMSDVDFSGVVDLKDVVKIQRFIAKLITAF